MLTNRLLTPPGSQRYYGFITNAERSVAHQLSITSVTIPMYYFICTTSSFALGPSCA